MSSTAKFLYRFVIGPKLIQLYNVPKEENYNMNKIEEISSIGKNICCFLFNLEIYLFIPLLLFGLDKLLLLYFGIFTLITRFILNFINLIGRFFNSTYRSFFEDYINVIYNNYNKNILIKYDFDFKYWPADFQATCEDPIILDELKPDSCLNHLFDLKYMFTWIIMRLFGRPLVYPGSTDVTKHYFEPLLNDGRASLVEQYDGKRAKICTLTGTEIDTMFLDRRDCRSGQFIVICSEGNCSFYECGCSQTVISLGYSILGWNHPGFGGSSNIPLMHEEKNAVFSVISYVIEKLGFPQNKIILYGWSIGGYSCAFGAALFPSIGSVICDGTFHSIIPVAKNSLADIFHPLVESVMTIHFNLNISELLCRYDGPLLILRRTNDEIVSLVTNDVSTNCGNRLALDVLQNRFPVLFTDKVIKECEKCIEVPAEARVNRYYSYRVNEEDCQSKLDDYFGVDDCCKSETFGINMNNDEKLSFAMFLLDKILCDVVERHSVPLPLEFFELPWKPCDRERFVGCHYHYVG